MAIISINISAIPNQKKVSTNSGSFIPPNDKSYFSLIDAQKNADLGVSVANDADWSRAWKEQQRQVQQTNLRKESHTDPSPLLIDIISSLPPSSARRRNYENLKLTLDGRSANVGYGLDTMSRESYQDLLRLSRQSEMLHHGMYPPNMEDVMPHPDYLIGPEEGQYAANIQGWRPVFANAGKPVSDALGSHIDIDAGLAKDSSGRAAFLPSSTSYLVDGISPHITNEIEGSFKKNQLEMMQHLPSKVVGSLRHISTALDSILSVPFEIASDVYNGLRQLMTQVMDLLDGIKTKITKWFFTAIGGLVDGLFPSGLLSGFISAISSIAKEFGGLFDLLGGFPVVSGIKDVLSDILSGNFMGALGSITKLAGLLFSGLGSGQVLGGFAGSSVFCIENQIGLGQASKSFKKLSKKVVTGLGIAGVIGALPAVLQGLGNLASVIGKSISKGFGSGVPNIRNLAGIIAGLLPMGLGFILNKMFGKLCNVGMTGNRGYSVGDIFDGHRNRAFDVYMNNYAVHASIVAPLFNKKSKPTGSYATEDAIMRYDNSSFVPGAQTTKGITVVGPGGSIAYRPYSSLQRTRSYGQTSLYNNSVTNNRQGSLFTINLF